MSEIADSPLARSTEVIRLIGITGQLSCGILRRMYRSLALPYNGFAPNWRR